MDQAFIFSLGMLFGILGTMAFFAWLGHIQGEDTADDAQTDL